MNGEKLPIMEDFYTLQGEGFHTGKAAYFLRVGGCDVGCNFCDVKEAWNADIHPLVEVDEVVNRILSINVETVVVTGGEPCLYNLDYLCHLLKQNHIRTHIETSGSHQLSGEWNWICFSPKKNTNICPEFYLKANELKVIVETDEDFQWAEYNANKVHVGCQLYLQPEWSKINYIAPKIVEYILQNPKWKISLQSHKYLNIP